MTFTSKKFCPIMDLEEFHECLKAVIEFTMNYIKSLREVDVLPNVEPGYLLKLLPEKAPEKAEAWQEVLKDVEKYIVPGLTHWRSPHFHAFYPGGHSHPSFIGEMICNTVASVGISWLACPAATELEVVIMNWVGKLLHLPKELLNCSEGPGGGSIQGSASETTFFCLTLARESVVTRTKRFHPEWDEHIIRSKLIAYASDQSNSSVEKAAKIATVSLRLLPSDDEGCLRGEMFLKALEEDVKKGLIPFCLIATLGTTPTCAFDKLDELGPICKMHNIWMHIDAAYAGTAFICPEYQHLMSGIEYCDSFNVNAHKFMLVHFDCSLLWLKDSTKVKEVCNVERVYLPNSEAEIIPDYRHWQFSLGRRFRSMKLWFVLRIFGAEGIQEHVRRMIRLTKIFENYVKFDNRFEIVGVPSIALVCFKIKGDNELTKELHRRLLADRKVFLTVATFKGKMMIRFMMANNLCEEVDVTFAWNEITRHTTEILQSVATPIKNNSQKTFTKSTTDVMIKIEQLNLESKFHKIS
ncbi:aromatic-L-amino-acid decarboxylase [Xylocopa sonorina]|uniref:aromatic-L-amino-acid decarboxylase n=1 Tax=Xylocopa sonorina TaxID=1818115 RepID=UPI00403AD336